MRYLHLIQPLKPPRQWWDWGSDTPGVSGANALAVCRSLIAANPADTHDLVVFGGKEAGREAAAAGLRDFQLLTPPLGRAAAAGGMLRGTGSALTSADTVLGWGSATRPLRALVAAQHAAWMELDTASGELLRIDTAGRVRERIARLPWSCDLESATPAHESVHRQLGATGRFILTLLHDDACPGDAALLPAVVGVVHAAAIPIHGVIPGGAYSLERAQRQVVDGGYVPGLTTWPEPLGAVLLGSDACVLGPWPGAQVQGATFAAGLLLVRAAGAGAAVIIPEPWFSALGLPPSLAALRARSAVATDVAAPLVAMLLDPGAPARLAEELRAWIAAQKPGLIESLSKGLRSRAPEH